MKKYLVSFLVGCFISFIIYLGFSFGNLSLDIRKWGEASRLLCAAYMVFAVFIPLLFVGKVNDENH